MKKISLCSKLVSNRHKTNTAVFTTQGHTRLSGLGFISMSSAMLAYLSMLFILKLTCNANRAGQLKNGQISEVLGKWHWTNGINSFDMALYVKCIGVPSLLISGEFVLWHIIFTSHNKMWWTIDVL